MNVGRSARGLGASLLCSCLPYANSAEGPPSAAPPSPEEAIAVEVFQGPKMKSGTAPAYPATQEADGIDGWVVLTMMIDPRGKPYEVSVADSTGNPGLERAAKRAIDNFSFVPGMRAGSPIDSSMSIRFNFELHGEKGANERFIRAYKIVTDAVAAGDRARADLELPHLKVQNLYEDAYKALAMYSYHRQWGTPEQQLADLQRVTAGSDSAKFLPAKTYRLALVSTLKLQIKLNDFGGALNTWKLLRPRAQPDELPSLQRTIDQVIALRAGAGVVNLAGKIGPNSNWHGMLFKPRFEVRVASGSVTEIKLRCEKGYVLFQYQSGITYNVQAGEGLCAIELLGDPETAFNLIQS